MQPWIFNGTPVTEVPEKAIGFIYKITYSGPNSGKRFYIGRKVFFHQKTTKLNKKGLLTRPKTGEGSRTKKKVTVKESDWLTYVGSNEELKLIAKQEDPRHFHREILQFCYSAKQLTYWEIHHIIMENALLSPLYFNDNLGGKIFSRELQ